jgi:hypothetical protein
MMLLLVALVAAAPAPAPEVVLCNLANAAEKCGDNACVENKDHNKECFWKLFDTKCHCAGGEELVKKAKQAEEDANNADFDDFFDDWNDGSFEDEEEVVKEETAETKSEEPAKVGCRKSKAKTQCGDKRCVMNDTVTDDCKWESFDYFCHCSDEVAKPEPETKKPETIQVPVQAINSVVTTAAAASIPVFAVLLGLAALL